MTIQQKTLREARKVLSFTTTFFFSSLFNNINRFLFLGGKLTPFLTSIEEWSLVIFGWEV